MNERYPYAFGDRLLERNTYFYSQCEGEGFLKDWKASRTALLEGQPTHDAVPEENAEVGARYPSPDEEVCTRDLLSRVRMELQASENIQGELSIWLAWLVKKFEVSKRLFPRYGLDRIAVDRSAFRELDLYVAFSETMAAAYAKTGHLAYLNALLKVHDTLVSVRGKLESSLLTRLRETVQAERRFIALLGRRDVGRAA